MAGNRDQISALLQLEHSVRRAETRTELNYVLCNQLRQLFGYDLAVLFRSNEREQLKIEAVSDHASIDRTAPFVSWFERFAREESVSGATAPHIVAVGEWSENKRRELAEFAPEKIVWVPLLQPSTKRSLGVLVLSRGEIWDDAHLALLAHFASTASHALAALERQSITGRLKRSIVRNRILHMALIALVGLMFLPVRLSVVAPAEIVAKEPFLVTAGINGTVRSVAVMPGDRVAPDTLLVEMDDTQYRSELEIAQKSLLRAQAELRTTERSGFVDARVKSRIAELQASVELRLAERDYAQKQLEKTLIRSDREGLVVLNDPQEWLGRPVTIGERILSIADPEQLELRIMLPVQDAIVLNHNEPIRLFLDSDPLNPVELRFVYATYEPEKTPEDILANKVIAAFDESKPLEHLRIGMRGTAKLYGDRVSLFYYLFRRPLTAVRQWVGW